MKGRDGIGKAAALGFAVWLALGAAATCLAAEATDAGAKALAQGDEVTVGGRPYRVARVDALPFVESEYTRRFTFDRFENPKLKELRERYKLDEVVARGKDEFERQVLLLDWVNHAFKKFGKPDSEARGALDILRDVEAGHTFFCSHYGDVFVSAAASMGWVDRALALRRPDNVGSGSTEHTSSEIWSNQYRKWILFDATFSMYVVRDGEGGGRSGVPLSAYEFRQEWFDKGGTAVTFVMDKDRKRFKRSDMPVLRGRYAGFGDLVFDGGATNVYAFIGYIPNTDLMDRGPDYGKMFITKDKLCDGTSWHQRDNPAHPATDPYFPIDQAAVTLTAAADGSAINVELKTLTPNFEAFNVRLDGTGEWKPVTGDKIAWAPHAGPNQLEVKAVNKFGVDGPISTVELTEAKKP